jgi:hypothetical protein
MAPAAESRLAGADPAPWPAPDALWLAPAAQDAVIRILASHQRAYGRPLLAGLPADATARQWAQALFAAETVVLAHDGADPKSDPGPRLIYANRAALRLWRRPWAELVGMPSQHTAEPAERPGRARDLAGAKLEQAIRDYSGVRIDSTGRRFRIAGARVWTLWSGDRNAGAVPCGQAAAFNNWWWL